MSMKTNQPDLGEVLEIMYLKEEANKLYAAVDQCVADMHAKYGAGRFDYDLDDLPEDGPIGPFVQQLRDSGQYLKFEITDNLKKLATEGIVFKSTSIKPVSFSASSLKRCPEALK